MYYARLIQAWCFLLLLLHFPSEANNTYNPKKFEQDVRYQQLDFLWRTWDVAYQKDQDFFSIANVASLEKILSKHWEIAQASNRIQDRLHAGIPLAFVYHNQAKFKEGLPVLRFLYQHLHKIPKVYWSAILIKLEEEFRGENDLEHAIPIRRKRIELGYIKTFWEIYWECGLVDDAIRDFLQNQPVPPATDYKRMFYYQRLGWLYFDQKQYRKSRAAFQKGAQTVDRVRKAQGQVYLPRELAYWDGVFQGHMAQCDMELGIWDRVIPMLKYDLQQSGDNPDNIIGKMVSLSRAYMHEKKYRLAKLYLDRAHILIAPKIIRPLKLNLLQSYATYFGLKKQYDSAFYYTKAYQAYQDTLSININRNKSILMLGQLELAKNREETLKSKLKVEEISESIKWQDYQIKALSFLLLSILLGSILLYINFRQKGLLDKNRIQLDLEHERNAILLKELHHRVKNNLQVIYSLLNLQKRRTKHLESIDLIKSLQNRIQTIALVHNNLFQSDEMEFVALDSYVRTLVEHLQQMYMQDELNSVVIQFQIDESIKLRFERIGTLGLIINEIVSNAFKYAFVGEEPGKLDIDIQRNGQLVRVAISDNGIGLVEEINSKSNLGMRLIRILSEQMGATYELQQHIGIKHVLTFTI